MLQILKMMYKVLSFPMDLIVDIIKTTIETVNEEDLGGFVVCIATLLMIILSIVSVIKLII